MHVLIVIIVGYHPSWLFDSNYIYYMECGKSGVIVNINNNIRIWKMLKK